MSMQTSRSHAAVLAKPARCPGCSQTVCPLFPIQECGYTTASVSSPDRRHLRDGCCPNSRRVGVVLDTRALCCATRPSRARRTSRRRLHTRARRLSMRSSCYCGVCRRSGRPRVLYPLDMLKTMARLAQDTRCNLLSNRFSLEVRRLQISYQNVVSCALSHSCTEAWTLSPKYSRLVASPANHIRPSRSARRFV